MNFDSLHNKVIRFNKGVETHEIDFDEGMRARVIGIHPDHCDSTVLELVVDFKEFEEENKKLMKANYYDANENPVLRWSETKGYPQNCRTTIYVDAEVEKFPLPFDVEEGNYPTVEECLDLIAVFHESHPSSVSADILKRAGRG